MTKRRISTLERALHVHRMSDASDDAKGREVTYNMANVKRELVERIVAFHNADEEDNLVARFTENEVNAMLHAFASIRDTWMTSNANAKTRRDRDKAILKAADKDPDLKARIDAILAAQLREAR
jgi:hypothetical protein